jgi:hypothetical protein
MRMLTLTLCMFCFGCSQDEIIVIPQGDPAVIFDTLHTFNKVSVSFVARNVTTESTSFYDDPNEIKFEASGTWTQPMQFDALFIRDSFSFSSGVKDHVSVKITVDPRQREIKTIEDTVFWYRSGTEYPLEFDFRTRLDFSRISLTHLNSDSAVFELHGSTVGNHVSRIGETIQGSYRRVPFYSQYDHTEWERQW